MNNVVLSSKYPRFSDEMRRRGYNVIPSEIIDRLISYEQDHADMQCLIIEDTAFVTSCCAKLAKELNKHYKVISCADNISGKYPSNVALNAAVVGKHIIARKDSLDPVIKEFCTERGYFIINVRQGYAKCSCAVVCDNAIITADRGIYNSVMELKAEIEVLLIEEGRVRLNGADHGFIGGASGLDTADNRRVLYFSGNIDMHPDSDRIREFCHKHYTDIISLTDGELFDIGGMIFC